MDEHVSYGQDPNRGPDFIVKYETDLAEEIKEAKPGQGMRVGFLYEGDNPAIEGVHMIWPEILDEQGHVVLDKTPGAINRKGYANMWVVNEDRRSYHKTELRLVQKVIGGEVVALPMLKLFKL